MKKKRLTALFLAAVMTVGLLAGCSNGEEGENSGPELVYNATFSAVDMGDINNINYSAYRDGKFYFYANYAVNSGSGETGEETGTGIEARATASVAATGEAVALPSYEQPTEYKNAIFSVNSDGTELTKLFDLDVEGYKTSEDGSVETGENIYNFTMDSNGNYWFVIHRYENVYEVPDNFDPENDSAWNYPATYNEKYYLVSYDGEGNEVKNIDLIDTLGINTDETYFYVNLFAIDGQGNAYISSDTFLYILPGEGAAKTINLADKNISWINTMAVAGNGTVYFSSYGETGQELYSITADGTISDPVPTDANLYNVIAGDDKYDFYYTDNSNFCGLDVETGTETILFNWINCNVDSDYLRTFAVTDNGVVGFSSSWNSDYTKETYELVRVNQVDASTLPEKTTLTFACMYLDYNIKKEILDFNKKSDAYRIEVLDYSQYNTNEDYSAGLTKLTTEIMAGNVPDMFSTDQMPISRFAARDLVEDLWPFIEGDTELGGRDGVVQSIFNAYTDDDGKLYQVGSTFNIATLVGLTKVVGDKMGWSFDEFYEVYSKMPEGCNILYRGMTKSNIAQTLFVLNLNNFVNWETGECHFDSQEFIDILKFTDLFPAEYDWEADSDQPYVGTYTMFSEGMQMLDSVSVYEFSDVLYTAADMSGSDMAITYVGFPGSAGNGAVAMMSSGIAMSSTCKDKDGAWQFMRRVLTPEFQENIYGLPTNKAVFDEKVKEATTVQYYEDENGEKVPQPMFTMYVGDELVGFTSVPQELMDKVLELIDTTDTVFSMDQSLLNILDEQCAPFFAGQKTAEETASAIQSRMKIYINEQR